MNGWVRKTGELNKEYRVTASGARDFVLYSGAAPTMETTLDGTNWHAVALVHDGSGRYTHLSSVSGHLLGGKFRLTAGDAEFYYYQED